MRVALVSPYALSVFGGVQTQTLAMSRELVARGHEVLVVAPDVNDRSRHDTPASVRTFGHLVSLPANGSRAPLTLSPLATRRAWFCVRQFKPDVVHFHEPFAPLIGWGVLRTHSAAALATFHRSGDGPALRYTRALLRHLARDVDVAVAVSASAAETVQRACQLVPDVLFNGFESNDVDEPREGGSMSLLVCVGRLERRKGVAHAIRAVLAHNARTAAPTWRLVVLGEGPERPALERLADANTSVEFVGALDDDAKRRWLRRANVVLAPALRGESFGLVLLEAMASDAAVVASDIPGYRDAAGGHAELFAPGDELELERAVERALERSTPERARMAREYARRWSMASLMDEYEVRYREAIDRFNAGR